MIDRSVLLLCAAALVAALGCGGPSTSAAGGVRAGDRSGAGTGQAGTPGDVAASDGRAVSPEMVVRRGTLHRRLVLSGELEAVDAEDITAPRTSEFRLQLKWLAEDGASLTAGERVADFDNSTFVSKLEELQLSAMKARRNLEQRRAELETERLESQLDVERARIGVEQAGLDAAVPAELHSMREHQEAQLELERARTDLAKAQQDIETSKLAGAADIEVLKLEMEKTQREIRAAESAIAELSLVAPCAGILIVSEHPWEGRKIKEGDSLWSGAKVGSIPDLDRMRVAAWLSDVDEGMVEKGMRVRCQLVAYPELVFLGTVTSVGDVAQEADSRSLRRFFRVEIGLDRSDRELMRPGMSVKVDVPVEVLGDQLLVPRASLEPEPSSSLPGMLREPDAGGAAGPDTPGDPEAAPPPMARVARVRLAAGGTREVLIGPCSAQLCAVEDGLDEGTKVASVWSAE